MTEMTRAETRLQATHDESERTLSVRIICKKHKLSVALVLAGRRSQAQLRLLPKASDLQPAHIS